MNKWQEINNALTKTFKFPDFDSALYFANQVGKIADKINHHPSLEVGWGKVVVTTTTHEAGNQITDKDWELAKQIDSKERVYDPNLQPPKTFSEFKELGGKMHLINGKQKRLPLDTEFFYTLSKLDGRHNLVQTLGQILKKTDTFWHINQFPYTFFLQSLPSVQHWVLWVKDGFTDEELEREVQKKFGNYDYFWFESRAKSVPEIKHIQVFVDFSNKSN